MLSPYGGGVFDAFRCWRKARGFRADKSTSNSTTNSRTSSRDYGIPANVFRSQLQRVSINQRLSVGYSYRNNNDTRSLIDMIDDAITIRQHGPIDDSLIDFSSRVNFNANTNAHGHTNLLAWSLQTTNNHDIAIIITVKKIVTSNIIR